MFGFRYPAVVLLLGAVAGTLLGLKLNLGLPIIVALFVAAACFLIYGYMRLPGWYFVLPLILLTVSAALLNSNKMYQSYPADHIGRYVDSGERLRYFGRIIKWPLLKRHKTVIACAVDSVSDGHEIMNASGVILVSISRETTHFALGDQICFNGALRKPFSAGYPGQFDYARYLSGQGIHGILTVSAPGGIMILKNQKNIVGREINHLRQMILKSFRKNLTELPAALASGFFIGETRDIPDDVYLAFRRTGTMHLLAVSGSNVALVLVVIAFLLRYVKLNRIPRLAIFLIVIVIFAHLSYNQPSVIRASIMAALLLIARTCYRRADLHNIIAAAATILIFYDPGNLFDIGFQLSFAVTWGLILFLPHINRLTIDLRLNQMWRYLMLVISSSLIATFISAPITAYYFGEISLVTALSNLIVVPLVSAAVVGIAILLLVNLVLPAAAILPGIFLDRLLGLIHLVVIWFGQWEYASTTMTSFSGIHAIASLAGVIMIMLAISYRFMRILLLCATGLAGAIMAVMIIFPAANEYPEVEIYNLNTAQTVIFNRGEGVVIFRPDGDDRRDAFSEDLLPFLERRNHTLPRYYIFIENRYRTENRLNQASDKGFDLDFRPRLIDPRGLSPSIWELKTSEADDSLSHGHIFYSDNGLVTVEFPDSCRILYAGSIEGLKLYPPDKLRQIKNYYVAINNDTEMGRIRTFPDPGKAILLLRQPVDRYHDSDFLKLAGPQLPRIIELEEKAAFISLDESGPRRSL